MKRWTFELDLMVQFCQLTLHLGIEIVPCRLLQRIFRMDMDWSLRKLGQLFQVLMTCLQKSPKTLLWLVLPDEICLIISS